MPGLGSYIDSAGVPRPVVGVDVSGTSEVFGAPTTTPSNTSILGRLKAVYDALVSIGSDTTPVPVQANLRSGLGAYTSYGSPSTSSDNSLGYSNPFIPNGEKVTLHAGLFTTGQKKLNWSGGGKIWLEADLQGGVSYKPVAGSLVTFASLLDFPTLSLNSGVNIPLSVRPFGNWRVVINFGTLDTSGGTSGTVGFNVFLLN